MTRWVKAFRKGRDVVQGNLRTGRPHVENNTAQLIASLLDADRRWTARELTAEVGVYKKTLLHILHDILGPANLQRVRYSMKFPRCNKAPLSSRIGLAGPVGPTEAKVTPFLDKLSLWTKPGLAHTNHA